MDDCWAFVVAPIAVGPDRGSLAAKLARGRTRNNPSFLKVMITFLANYLLKIHSRHYGLHPAAEFDIGYSATRSGNTLILLT